MRKLAVFDNITLDGFFTAANGDFTWAKGHMDPEFNAFVEQNAQGKGELLFGRVTYQLMMSYWPTPMAAKNDPVVAERMNNLSKIVFSRTLDKATWKNTRLIKDDVVEAIRRMKQESGDSMVILGSGRIVSQLAAAGLIDEYQIVLNPVALGTGRTLFDGVKQKLSLKLSQTRAFSNGSIFLRYEPAA